MANTEEAKEKKNEITEEDTRLDKKVKVRSIAPWITGAPRVTSKAILVFLQMEVFCCHERKLSHKHKMAINFYQV